MPAEECTRHCVSVAHGNKITSALTKRAVKDSELCAYLNSVCEFSGSSRDGGGKMALHMAASCGRTDVCKWLICQKQARIDERDRESGYTALHRSIFYGRIDTSVSLIKLGANMNLLDNNDLTPLDHAAEDNLIPQNCIIGSNLDEQVPKRFIYVWGSNSNYTLGPQQTRNTPEILDIFHKKYKPDFNVIQVCLEKFHTVILTQMGEVFTYGLGQGGRLGLNCEKPIVEPSHVNFVTPGGKFLMVVQVAAARDHTMFLMDNGSVYVCGLNTHHVLGAKLPLLQALVPKVIVPSFFKQKIIGICCGRFHSVAWSKHILYTWGLNAGQLGFAKDLDTYITTPKSVPNVSVTESNEIVSVAASDGATTVATNKGDIYVLHEYQCRKIASRLLNIQSLTIIGGTLDTSNNKIEFTKRELKVIVLTQTGTLFIWQESDPQLNRCIFPLHRLLDVKEVRLHYDGLILLTKAREVFHGKIKPRKKTILQEKQKKETPEKCKTFHKFLDKTDCVLIQLTRVSKLYFVDSISCDPKGENFAALNINTACFIKKMEYCYPSTIVYDFEEILLKPDVADITFKIGNSTFPAHKYIIANGSDKLRKLIDDNNGGNIIIDNVQPEIFEQLLKYLYSFKCDLLHVGIKCPQNLLKYCVNNTTKQKKTKRTPEDNNKSAYEVYKEESKTKKDDTVIDPIRLLQEAAKKMGVNTLFKELNGVMIVDEMIMFKKGVWCDTQFNFEVNSFPNYYDVAIISKNGKAMDAHKCVLAARCEFFDNMFSTRWNESEKKSEISLPFPQSTLTHLLSYLYTNYAYIQNEDLDGLINLLILSDHLLIPRLLNICELYIARCISMKTVIKILTISHCYNAKQLKQCAMEYINLNLPLCFETRILEQIEPEILKDLTTFYAEYNKKMSCRVITPFSDAVDDDNIKKVSTEHPINMDFEEEIIKAAKEKPQRKRNRSHKLSISDRMDSCKENIPIESSFSSDICEESVTSTPKAIPSRIHAINSAHEKMKLNECEDNYVNISSKLNSSNESYKDDFPDLSISYTSPDSYSKSPNKGDRFDKHKMQKMSQKQRKRLLSENSTKETEKEIVPEAPRNPWKIIDPTSPVGSPDTNVNITNIITEEKKQKENLSKIKSKKLIYTQIEDKAIEDLQKFYNVDNVFDEIVFINRVEIGLVATPVWVQK